MWSGHIIVVRLVFFRSIPLVVFDHIYVHCPASFKGNGLLLDIWFSYFLAGGSVIYPDWEEFTPLAVGRVRFRRMVTCPHLRPDIIAFVLAGRLIFVFFVCCKWIFRCSSLEGFSQTYFAFSTALLLLVSSLCSAGFAESYHLGVTCALSVEDIWYSNCCLQELTPLYIMYIKILFFFIKVFVTVESLRVFFSLSHAIVYWYHNIFCIYKMPKLHNGAPARWRRTSEASIP